MPLPDRPTLRQLFDRILADFTRPEVDTFLRRSFERYAAAALAAVSHGFYGYLDGLVSELNPRTCSERMLLRWCSAFGVERKSPTKATGDAVFQGSDGSVLDVGAAMQRSDGVRYIVTVGGTVAGGSVTVTVEAETAGAAGLVEGPGPLRLSSPVSGIQSLGAFDADGAFGGTDLEELEDLRERLLDRLGSPQRGGATPDYVAWVRETPSVDVENVFPYPSYYGPGTVGVTFTVRGDDPIPSEPERAAVFAHVDPLRPIDMHAFGVFVLEAQPVSYEIEISPYSGPVRAAISAALRDLHRREARPGQPLLVSRIREAISTASGERDHRLLSPTTDVVPSSAIHLPTFSTPTYSELS